MLAVTLGAGRLPLHAQRLIQNPPALPLQAPVGDFEVVNAFPQVRFPISTDLIIGLAVPQGQTNELFVTGQLGRILVITNLAAPTRTVFLDLSAVTFSGGESGLLGLAFHPSYADNRQFYVFYTRTNRETGQTFDTLSRFLTDPDDPYRALPESEEVLISQLDRDVVHQGGDLQFGPDGYLYVPVGDEGGQNDFYQNTQRIDGDFFSGILRLDVDGRPGSLTPHPHPALGTGYRIPPDNPFVGATSFHGKTVNPDTVRTEFWAVGLRNPHRIHFDSQTGELYAGDVGGVRREEINRVTKGSNHGWAHFEGSLLNDQSLAGPPPEGAVFTPPVYEYTRAGGDPNMQGQSVIGGLVYRGTNYPSLVGKYIYGDFLSRHIWSLAFQGTNRPTVTRLVTPPDHGPTGFGIHPGTGDILLVQRFGERISRLARRVGEGPRLPATLSETGVFADLATLTPREEVEPYDIISPFWSDYALKRRWFFFQDAASQVRRNAADQWSFPAGMVWVKHFELELTRGNPTTRRRLETRFMVTTTNAAYGITYRWRPDESDADLVPDEGYDEDIPVEENGVITSQIWHYPGRSECLTCHNPAAGFILGFHSRQLNRDRSAPGTTVNQLTHLSGLGVFDPPISNAASLPRLVAMDDPGASLERRFQSYLDVNCAYCHRPDGLGRGSWDGRFNVPLARSGLINGSVTDNLGLPDARVIRPGDINASVLWRRISALDLYHMPPLYTSVVHQAGIDLVKRFVEDATYVVGRHLFYNASAFDGRDPGANAADDRAVALNKEALLPGGRATLAHVSSYSRGLNGVMIDVWKLPALPLASDLRVRVGNDDTPATWTAGPSPSGITLRRGAGVAGSDRITLTWPEGAIARQWVELSLLPSARTGLENPDTFYLGSAPGDTGDQTTSAGVDAADLIRVRNNPRNHLNPAPLNSLFDINRDRQVDSLDQALIRMNQTRGEARLSLIDLTTAP